MPNPILAVLGVKAAGSIISGRNASKAAKTAAAAQAAGQEKALALQKDVFDKQVGYQEPYRQAGQLSTNELMRQMGLSGDAASAGYGNMLQDFGATQFQADPGYAFRLSEGLKAQDRTAAMRGGLISGSAIKAGQKYGQDMASQEYQNAYNRYNTNRNTRYNMLSGQQAVGQAASNELGNAAQNYGVTGGNYLTGAANARATGYQNVTAAHNALIGNLANIGSDFAGGYKKTWGPGVP